MNKNKILIRAKEKSDSGREVGSEGEGSGERRGKGGGKWGLGTPSPPLLQYARKILSRPSIILLTELLWLHSSFEFLNFLPSWFEIISHSKMSAKFVD